jgi:deoxyribonuclease-4
MVIRYIGAHINREKTLMDTIKTISKNGGNALQIFVSNPRSATKTNIENYIKIAPEIKNYLLDNKFSLVIHAPYTINLAKEFRNGKRIIPLEECYWVQLILHELYISNMIGAIGVVVHVGKHVSLSYENGLENMEKVLHYVINKMIEYRLNTKIIIETPAGQGTELLKDLNKFTEFFNRFSKDEKSYLGICVDTAHVWSAGYELDIAYKIIFSKLAKYVSVIHYNNSEKGMQSMVDKHAPIFEGNIPQKMMEEFLQLVSKNKGNPIIILETPTQNYDMEIEWVKERIQ